MLAATPGMKFIILESDRRVVFGRTIELTRRCESKHLRRTKQVTKHAYAARVHDFLNVSNIQNKQRQITETLQGLRTHTPGMVGRRCLSFSRDKMSLYRTPWSAGPVCTMAMPCRRVEDDD